MFNTIASVVIHAPVEAVYHFLSQPRNRLKYDRELLDVHHSPEGPLQLGSQIVEVRQWLGQRGKMVTEVSELKLNRRIGYRTLKGDPMNAWGAYQFDPCPEGTRLTLNFTVAPTGIVRLLASFVTRNLKQNIAAGLQNIKVVVENSSASATSSSVSGDR